MAIKTIHKEELVKACREYSSIEAREKYYYWAVDLYDNNYKLPAIILLLSVWNFAYFRYVVTSKKFLPALENAIDKSSSLFTVLKDENFQGVNFEKIGSVVKQIYNILSEVKGVRYVGATKIMHLINRQLFVMWDTSIRENYGFGTSADDYLNFLKEMRRMFGGIEWQDKKPLTKAIDEFNYVIKSNLNSNKKEE